MACTSIPNNEKPNREKPIKSDLPVPKISIIISTFNSGKTLEKCLTSIFQQDFKNWELIVIDGQSTDNTVDILKQSNANINYWISEADTGIYNAWNKALNHAKGDWIYFLGGDDYLWNSSVLQTIAPVLKDQGTQYKIIYGSIALIAQNGEILGYKGRSWQETKKSFLRSMTLPHQGLFQAASLFEEHGHFDEGFKISGDYEFLLRELVCKDAFFMSNIIVAGMLENGVSSKPENVITMLKEDYRAQAKHGLLKNPFSKNYRLAKISLRTILTNYLGVRKLTRVVNIYRFLARKPRLPNSLES